MHFQNFLRLQIGYFGAKTSAEASADASVHFAEASGFGRTQF